MREWTVNGEIYRREGMERKSLNIPFYREKSFFFAGILPSLSNSTKVMTNKIKDNLYFFLIYKYNKKEYRVLFLLNYV